eukprot:2461181-Pyramimonas_sp.AAC.1
MPDGGASSPSSPVQNPRSNSPEPAAGSGALPTRVHVCLHACRHAWKRSWQRFRSAAGRSRRAQAELPYSFRGVARTAFRCVPPLLSGFFPESSQRAKWFKIRSRTVVVPARSSSTALH